MEGRQIQHEVPVAGLAVAALAVPVFDLDESPPRQLLERTPFVVPFSQDLLWAFIPW